MQQLEQAFQMVLAVLAISAALVGILKAAYRVGAFFTELTRSTRSVAESVCRIELQFADFRTELKAELVTLSTHVGALESRVSRMEGANGEAVS